MRLFFKIIISVFAVIGLLLVSVTALLFLPSFQQRLKTTATDALSEKLGTEVSIDSASISPLSGAIALFGLDLEDRAGEPMLHADTIYGEVKLVELFKQNVDITDIKLAGAKANLYKERPDTAANYQFVLDAFKQDKKEGKKKNNFFFNINNIDVTNTELHWAVHSDPNSKLNAALALAKYNKGEEQIKVKNLKADYQGKSVSLGSIEFNTDSKSGILDKLSANDKGNSVSIDKVVCDSLKTFCINGIRVSTDNGRPRLNYNKPDHGDFDPGHMKIEADLRLTAYSLKSDSIVVSIDKLRGEDKASGLIVDSLSALVQTDTKTATISNLFVKDQKTTVSIPKINVYGLKSLVGKNGGDDFSFSTSTIYGKTNLCNISKPFAPVLKDFTTPLELTTWAEGTKDHLDFHKINVCTTDRRLKIVAEGYIDNLLSKTGIVVHFDIAKASARNGIKEIILSHFPFKQSMEGVLEKIGDVGFVGSVDIPYMKQNINGKLQTNAGSAKFDIHLDNTTRYVKGSVASDSINLGRIIGNPHFGNLTFEASFMFDIAGRRSAKELGRTVDRLPAGYAKGVAHEAHYRKFVLRNTYFNINSNGKEASGDVRVASSLIDFLCKFSFTDTNFPRSMRFKPSLRFHKMSEDAKKRRAEKKAKKKAEKEAKKAKKATEKAAKKAAKEAAKEAAKQKKQTKE